MFVCVLQSNVSIDKMELWNFKLTSYGTGLSKLATTDRRSTRWRLKRRGLDTEVIGWVQRWDEMGAKTWANRNLMMKARIRDQILDGCCKQLVAANSIHFISSSCKPNVDQCAVNPSCMRSSSPSFFVSLFLQKIKRNLIYSKRACHYWPLAEINVWRRTAFPFCFFEIKNFSFFFFFLFLFTN